MENSTITVVCSNVRSYYKLKMTFSILILTIFVRKFPLSTFIGSEILQNLGHCPVNEVCLPCKKLILKNIFVAILFSACFCLSPIRFVVALSVAFIVVAALTRNNTVYGPSLV